MENNQINRAINNVTEEIIIINDILDEVRFRLEKAHIDLIISIEPNLLYRDQIDCENCNLEK